MCLLSRASIYQLKPPFVNATIAHYKAAGPSCKSFQSQQWSYSPFQLLVAHCFGPVNGTRCLFGKFPQKNCSRITEKNYIFIWRLRASQTRRGVSKMQFKFVSRRDWNKRTRRSKLSRERNLQVFWIVCALRWEDSESFALLRNNHDNNKQQEAQ